MNPLDMYSRMLEKRAVDSALLSEDSQEAAHSELMANQADQRSELTTLFSRAGEQQKKDSKLMGQCLPQAKKTPGTAGSCSMLKVATQGAFFEGLRSTGLLKTADPVFLRTAYSSFQDELEKIGVNVFKVAPSAVDKAAKLTSRLGAATKPRISASTIKPTGNIVR